MQILCMDPCVFALACSTLSNSQTKSLNQVWFVNRFLLLSTGRWNWYRGNDLPPFRLFHFPSFCLGLVRAWETKLDTDRMRWKKWPIRIVQGNYYLQSPFLSYLVHRAWVLCQPTGSIKYVFHQRLNRWNSFDDTTHNPAFLEAENQRSFMKLTNKHPLSPKRSNRHKEVVRPIYS